MDLVQQSHDYLMLFKTGVVKVYLFSGAEF